MTDRYSGFLVALAADIREDDAEATIAAIMQIKNVVSVQPVNDDPGMTIAKIRARRELVEKLWDVLT